ncbi:mRNA guanylyltransferase [Pancytospora epiphaga]|nr:mRNA guanylyltransferase [Pancytospora epiphaga]
METEQFGTKLNKEQCTSLYQAITSILKTRKNGSEFIGSHPVSLTMSNVHLLLGCDYFVCEKTDGIRIMLLIYEKILYFYDRKNNFYRTRYAAATNDIFLFDGELYNEDKHHIFSIFDSLIIKCVDVTGLNLLDRLKGALSFTYWLAKSEENLLISNIPSLLRFSIITKKMAKSHGFREVLEAIPSLDHMNDGLIFTPVNEKYTIGARSNTLKWKPPELNTIDFLIKKTEYDDIFDLFCSVALNQRPICRKRSKHDNSAQDKDNIKFASFYFPDAPGNLDNKIGEFIYDKTMKMLDPTDYGVVTGGWSLYKIRTDKNSPNNIKVIIGLIESIRDNISEKDLRDYHRKIYENYVARKLCAEKGNL